MMAFALVILVPSPTIIPDRIGIIGKTHGVNANRNPRTKNEITLMNKLLSFKVFVIRSCSDNNVSS